MVENIDWSKADPEVRQSLARNPAAAKLGQLVVAYAQREGGLTLRFLQMFHGLFWGSKVNMTMEDCAQELHIPEAELDAIYERMMAEIQPFYVASTEYKSWIKSIDQ